MTATAVPLHPLRSVPLYVWLITLGVMGEVVSGNTAGWGLPISPDRLLIPAGLVLFLLHPDCHGRVWRVRGVHLFMVAITLWCTASILSTRSGDRRTAVFALVDSVGVLPFVLFSIAPVVFGNATRRHLLVLSSTILGLYIGAISCLEGIHAYSLVWPRYIYDPTSSHFGRAGGPSAQVASNGLQLMACGACAVMLALTCRGWKRLLGIVVSTLCAVGGFFTMTRSVWIGMLLGACVALVCCRPARKWLAVSLVGIAVAVVAVLSVDSSMREMVMDRVGDDRSAIDRINAASAAVSALQSRPAFGVGFNNFHNVEVDWLWQSPTLPLTATGIAVHNVFLSYATELGIPGLTLWLGAVGAAGLLAWQGTRRRDRPFDLVVLRYVLLAYAVCWFTIGMFVPITYAQPTAFLWIFAGLQVRPSAVARTLRHIRRSARKDKRSCDRY